MKIAYTFRRMETSEALRSYAQAKLEKLDRYLHEPAEAEITFSVEGRQHAVAAHVMAGPESYRGYEASDDMRASVDACVDKIRVQLTSAKGGRRAQRRQGLDEVALAPTDTAAEAEPEPEDPS